MNRSIMLVAALAVLSFASTVTWAETPPQQHSFAIYVAEGLDKRAIMRGTDDWRDAALADTPLITDADLVSYDIMQHAMTLAPDAMARLPKPPVEGIPFVVVVNGERIYLGAFATSLSSIPTAVPSICVDRWAVFPDEPANTVFIDRAYPPHLPGPGADPRSDERLIAALKKLGKLVARGPNVDQTLTQKISLILLDCQRVKKGVTRAELLNVFTIEGGLSTATQRTYVHRRCPYIKMDVEFNLSEDVQSAVDERPSDTIKKVSRPYLNWSIMD